MLQVLLQALMQYTSKQAKKRKEEGELAYEPHSPYYSPVHPPEFYEDE